MQILDLPLYSNLPAGVTSGEDRGHLRPDRFLTVVNEPRASVCLAPRPSGAMVVICPGGGYQGVCLDKEGLDFARLLAGWGISSLVLTYRLPGGVYTDPPLPLQDAWRALRLARHHAKAWRVNPGKLGIMGFSAGGHLALMAAMNPVPGLAEGDAVDREEARAGYMILAYPVVSFRDGLAHQGSRDNLLGKNPPASLVNRYSWDLQVNDKTPPAFVIHSEDDPSVPVGNSLALEEAMKARCRGCELTLYPTGGHGYGMGPLHGFMTAPDWTPLLFAWFLRGPVLATSTEADDLGELRQPGL